MGHLFVATMVEGGLEGCAPSQPRSTKAASFATSERPPKDRPAMAHSVAATRGPRAPIPLRDASTREHRRSERPPAVGEQRLEWVVRRSAFEVWVFQLVTSEF